MSLVVTLREKFGDLWSLFQAAGHAPTNHANLLRKRFTVFITGTLVGIAAAAVLFHSQLTGINQIIDDTRLLNDRMYLFHTADFTGRVIAVGRFDERFLTHMDQELRQYLKRTEAVLTASEHSLIDLVFAGLDDPEQYGPTIAERLGELSDLHHQYDKRLISGFGEFSEWFRIHNLSMLFFILLISILVIGSAMLQARDLIAGLRLLMRKIDMIESGGDPKTIVVSRKDEIGEIGKAIDVMHAAMEVRETETMINRQLMVDRQKMCDIVNLAGGIAHEVSNPLGALFMNLDRHEELWRGVTQCPPDKRKALEASMREMRRAIERIENLIHDISSFPGEEAEEVEKIDVNALLSRIVSMVRLDERTRKVQFDTKLRPDVPAVSAPRGKMALALYSVVSTAAERLHEREGTATFETLSSTFAGDRQLGLVIHIEGAREPFPTDGPSGRDDFGGENPTLRAARRTLDELGGVLNVRSTPSGSFTFLVRLPLSTRRAPVPPEHVVLHKVG